jgi:hypothetical protein
LSFNFFEIIRRHGRLLISLIIFGSCDYLNSPSEIQYDNTVLFNLSVNEEKQEIYIYHTINQSIEDTLSGHIRLKDIFVHNAEITIYSISDIYGNFIIEEAPVKYNYSKGFFYSNNHEINLTPNTQYSLEIKLENDLISGETTTPGSFDILEPKHNSTITLNSSDRELLIWWTVSNYAMGYLCEIIHEHTVTYPDSSLKSFTNNYNFYSRDTLLNFSGLRLGTYTIDVYAIDENYYNHLKEDLNSSGLKGAYGYFGSSIKKSVSFYVK